MRHLILIVKSYAKNVQMILLLDLLLWVRTWRFEGYYIIITGIIGLEIISAAAGRVFL